MIIAGVIATEPVRVQIANIVSQVANGTSISVTTSAVAIVTGGFPPYTHDWTDDNANVFVQTSAASETGLRSTGTDVIRTGHVIHKLTEANGAVTTTSATFNIVHGTP